MQVSINSLIFFSEREKPRCGDSSESERPKVKIHLKLIFVGARQSLQTHHTVDCLYLFINTTSNRLRLHILVIPAHLFVDTYYPCVVVLFDIMITFKGVVAGAQ